jgi:hypothetical protein
MTGEKPFTLSLSKGARIVIRLYQKGLSFVVVEARIEARLLILDTRASFLRVSGFDTSIVNDYRLTIYPNASWMINA